MPLLSYFLHFPFVLPASHNIESEKKLTNGGLSRNKEAAVSHARAVEIDLTFSLFSEENFFVAYYSNDLYVT